MIEQCIVKKGMNARKKKKPHRPGVKWQNDTESACLASKQTCIKGNCQPKCPDTRWNPLYHWFQWYNDIIADIIADITDPPPYFTVWDLSVDGPQSNREPVGWIEESGSEVQTQECEGSNRDLQGGMVQNPSKPCRALQEKTQMLSSLLEADAEST